MLNAMKIRDDWRQRLAGIVEGKNLAGISKKAGLGATYLRDVLEGSTPGLASAQKLSEKGLEIPLTDWFISDNSQAARPPPAPPPAESHASNADKDELLEVRGMAEGGKDGWNLWNGDVIQTIRRPEKLIGVAGAYAVYVTGTSMEPRYHPGELVHIHPGMPKQPGNYVLVQRKPLHEGDPPLAVVKKLVRRSGSKVTLAQLNPPKTFEVPADEVISIHKIVGSSEA